MNEASGGQQVRLKRHSPSYWRVTFDHPPLNIFGPDTIPQLAEVITSLETDPNVKVVVFDATMRAPSPPFEPRRT
jgi:enoyl-CoA hydratase/carnithine racemase